MPLQEFMEKFAAQQESLANGAKQFEMLFSEAEKDFSPEVHFLIERPDSNARRQKKLKHILFTMRGLIVTYKWGELKKKEILFDEKYNVIDVDMKSGRVRLNFQNHLKKTQRITLEFVSVHRPRLMQFLAEIVILQTWVPMLEKGRGTSSKSDGKASLHERLNFFE